MGDLHATQKENRVRYSDEELLEFKEIILKKLEKANMDLEIYLENIKGNPNGTDDTYLACKEDGARTSLKETNSKLAYHQQKIIDQLNLALIRIENKTYGFCRTCKNLIGKPRLRSVPTTEACMTDKEMEKRNELNVKIGAYQIKTLLPGGVASKN